MVSCSGFGLPLHAQLLRPFVTPLRQWNRTLLENGSFVASLVTVFMYALKLDTLYALSKWAPFCCFKVEQVTSLVEANSNWMLENDNVFRWGLGGFDAHRTPEACRHATFSPEQNYVCATPNPQYLL